MTAKSLISILSTLPPETELFVETGDCGIYSRQSEAAVQSAHLQIESHGVIDIDCEFNPPLPAGTKIRWKFSTPSGVPVHVADICTTPR